jgi:hypothetical protein
MVYEPVEGNESEFDKFFEQGEAKIKELDALLADARMRFEEEKDRYKTSMQTDLNELEAFIKERGQGKGRHGFDRLRTAEATAFDVAGTILRDVLPLEQEAKALTVEYERGLNNLKAEAARIGKDGAATFNLPQQIKACEKRLKELKAWSGDSELEFYESVLVDEARAVDIDTDIATCFVAAEEIENLFIQSKFKQDLARLKKVMQAVAADADVVVEGDVRRLFGEMYQDHFKPIFDAKKGMEILLAEGELSPVQRTTVQALQDEIHAMGKELGLPAQEALRAFERHFNTAPTSQAALKDAIEHGIDGLKDARVKLKAAQDKNQDFLHENALRAKANLSERELNTIRRAEDAVLNTVRPLVWDVATQERKLQTLIGQYEGELARLESQAAGLTPEGQTRLGIDLSKDIKPLKKILEGFKAWKASSDFGDFAALLNVNTDAIAASDLITAGFLHVFEERKKVFQNPQFAKDLALLKHSMQQIAEDKSVMLGAQEQKTYQGIRGMMLPLHGMKQELDELLAPSQDAPALTVAQQAALEAVRDNIVAMESEFALPTKDELDVLEQHAKVTSDDAEVDELFDELEEINQKLPILAGRVRDQIQEALKFRSGTENREHAEAIREAAKSSIELYKKNLTRFRAELKNPNYQALRLEDTDFNTHLAEFEKVLTELEQNINEPWDLAWVSAQVDILSDGAKNLLSGGWEGLTSLGSYISAGFSALGDIAQRMRTPVYEAVLQEEAAVEMTPYQTQVSEGIDTIRATMKNEMQATTALFEEERKKLLGMIPKAPGVLGMNFFGEAQVKPPTLGAFQAQQAVVRELTRTVDDFCKDAQSKIKGWLEFNGWANDEHSTELTTSQLNFCSGVESQLTAMQTGSCLTEAQAAQVAAYEATLTLTPYQEAVQKFIDAMSPKGELMQDIMAQVKEFEVEKAKLFVMLPGFISGKRATEAEFTEQKGKVDKLHSEINVLSVPLKLINEILQPDTSSDDTLKEGQSQALGKVKDKCEAILKQGALTPREKSQIAHHANQFLKRPQNLSEDGHKFKKE